MRRPPPTTRPLAAGLLLAVSCCALALAITMDLTSPLGRAFALTALLGVPAVICARACASPARPLRLTLSFVLAAVVVLPAPLAILVAAAAVPATADAA